MSLNVVEDRLTAVTGFAEVGALGVEFETRTVEVGTVVDEYVLDVEFVEAKVGSDLVSPKTFGKLVFGGKVADLGIQRGASAKGDLVVSSRFGELTSPILDLGSCCVSSELF